MGVEVELSLIVGVGDELIVSEGDSEELWLAVAEGENVPVGEGEREGEGDPVVDELLEGEDDRLGELVAEGDKLPVPEAEELPLAEELRLGESDMLKEGDREELRVTELDGEAVGVSVFEPVGDSLLVVEDVVTYTAIDRSSLNEWSSDNYSRMESVEGCGRTATPTTTPSCTSSQPYPHLAKY